MRGFRFIFLQSLVMAVQFAQGEDRGVFDEPSGQVDLRADKNGDAPVAATIKSGEPFTYECEKDAGWCKVSAASGRTGWVESIRIRYYYTEKDLPVREKGGALSEIDEMARGRGLDYASVTRRAARGDAKALKQFFALAEDADGAAAESISGIPTIVYHLLGDAKFAAFLAAQPIGYQIKIRNMILNDGFFPSANSYFRRHFPETTRLLFRREVTDWPSPDGRFAIRKVFSDELELKGSKVVRSELIDRKSGAVLCDLTSDDIGTGAQREGEVLWSPDSKRVACLSIDLPQGEGTLLGTPRPPLLRKQTALYQLSGDKFVRVDLSLGEVPGRNEDTELEKAVLGHEYIEPLRWAKPNVLVLQRHEYYERFKPLKVGDSTFDTIHPFDRMYQITVTLAPDGKAAVVWKQRKNM